LEARTTAPQRPRSAWASNSSLWPQPYMSEESMKLMPRSRARWINAMDSGSWPGPQAPEKDIPPRPRAETDSELLPSVRRCMGPPVPGGAGFYYTARAARLSSGAWHVRVAHGAAEAAPNEPPLPPHHPESRLPRLPSPRCSPPSPSTSPRSRSPNPSVGARRVIFFDVENTSRPEHIARMIEHLSIDRQGRRTDFVAVGNWRVIGSDTGRLLARHGAHLVHSAPSTGVRDWSDLRIAVTAGVWLGGARPGDVLEIVSDDRAFDAVGDVASTLGVSFKRLSYRALIGAHAAVLPAEREMPDSRGRSRRGRRGRGGRPRHRPPQLAPAPVAPVERLPIREAPADESAHSAPHDEIVGVVRELVERTSDHSVLIDTLANALKSRGFRRPPGSPRLITRLRRIKELSVSPTGMITLV